MRRSCVRGISTVLTAGRIEFVIDGAEAQFRLHPDFVRPSWNLASDAPSSSSPPARRSHVDREAALREISSLLTPSNNLEAALHMHCSWASQHSSRSDGVNAWDRLAAHLHGLGHRVYVRKSAPVVPRDNFLRNLRHTSLIVCPDDATARALAVPAGTQVVVDPAFRDQFRIPFRCSGYESILVRSRRSDHALITQCRCVPYCLGYSLRHPATQSRPSRLTVPYRSSRSPPFSLSLIDSRPKGLRLWSMRVFPDAPHHTRALPLQEDLPCTFVGSPATLRKLVTVVAGLMARVFDAHRVYLGPWRTPEALSTKWISHNATDVLWTEVSFLFVSPTARSGVAPPGQEALGVEQLLSPRWSASLRSRRLLRVEHPLGVTSPWLPITCTQREIRFHDASPSLTHMTRSACLPSFEICNRCFRVLPTPYRLYLQSM